MVCFGFAIAHGGDLGIGEHDRRHRRQVQRRVAAGHVDRGAGTGRRCDVDELRLVGAVARGVDVRCGGAHPIVDDDGALRVDRDTCRVEIQGAGVRCAAGGDQQSVSAQFAAPGREHECSACKGHLTGLRVLQHFDAFVAERGRDGFTYSGIFAEEQRVARQESHLAAESGKGLREFDRHHRRTDHRQPLGNTVADQRLGGGPVGGALQAGDRRNRRAGAGGDQAAVEGDCAFAAFCQLHVQMAVVQEAGVAA